MRTHLTIIILGLLLIGGCTIGEAFRSPVGFALPSDQVEVSLLATTSEEHTINVSVTGYTHVLSRIYYTLDGDLWDRGFLTEGNQVVPGERGYAVTIPAGATTGASLIVYACNRDGSSWDCNDNRWQKTGIPIVAPGTSFTTCGDGVLQDHEACDDSDQDNSDGCSENCTIESGWGCAGEPSVCILAASCSDEILNQDEVNIDCGGVCPACVGCGNGIIEDDEQCDDENTDNTDGCTTSCTINFCGDGFINATEECDDDETFNNDGCSQNCSIESGWSCTGEPSLCSVI